MGKKYLQFYVQKLCLFLLQFYGNIVYVIANLFLIDRKSRNCALYIWYLYQLNLWYLFQLKLTQEELP